MLGLKLNHVSKRGHRWANSKLGEGLQTSIILYCFLFAFALFAYFDDVILADLYYIHMLALYG